MMRKAVRTKARERNLKERNQIEFWREKLERWMMYDALRKLTSFLFFSLSFPLFSFFSESDAGGIHKDESEYSPGKSSCPGIKQIHRVSNNREKRNWKTELLGGTPPPRDLSSETYNSIQLMPERAR